MSKSHTLKLFINLSYDSFNEDKYASVTGIAACLSVQVRSSHQLQSIWKSMPVLYEAWALVAVVASSAMGNKTESEQLLPPAQRDNAGFQMLHQPLMRAFESHMPPSQCGCSACSVAAVATHQSNSCPRSSHMMQHSRGHPKGS